ncbi:MAG: hypothetical protein VX265_14850, partial [Myxococcota bacterium]|nr:hypothetical protein [Myxococcota bacterium]
MLDALASGVRDLWVAGGFVMPPLFVLTGVLWFALGWRLLALRRGDARPMAAVLAAGRAGHAPAGRGVIVQAVRALVKSGAAGPGAPTAALRAHL